MRKTFLYTGILFSVLLANCNLEQKSYTAEIAQLEDTLFKAFPSVNRVSIEVKNDFGTEINVTLGDATLYTASDAERNKVAGETGNIIAHIFKPDDLPGKGTVIFVKEENTIQVDEASKVSVDMGLEARKKE
jgi:hypothetical protein